MLAPRNILVFEWAGGEGIVGKCACCQAQGPEIGPVEPACWQGRASSSRMPSNLHKCGLLSVCLSVCLTHTYTHHHHHTNNTTTSYLFSPSFGGYKYEIKATLFVGRKGQCSSSLGLLKMSSILEFLSLRPILCNLDLHFHKERSPLFYLKDFGKEKYWSGCVSLLV